MGRPLCAGDADTTQRLNAVEDAVAATASGASVTDLQEQIDDLVAVVAALDARVVVLEGA